MPIKAPSYLLKNRHGTFYFRIAIPCATRPYFNGRRELRKSMGTKDLKEALALSRRQRVELEDYLREAMRLSSGASDCP